MSMFLNSICAGILGVLMMFPGVGYAQKTLPKLKNIPTASPSRLVRKTPFATVVGRPAARVQVPVRSAGVFKFVPLTRLEHSYTSVLFVRNPLPARLAFPGKDEVDAVIFDLDGTLLDSLSAWEHSGSNFVRTQGFEPPPTLDDELVKMSLMDGANLIKTRYQLPQSPEEILALTLLPIERHYYEDILPMPGVPETLARLKAQGVKMVIATASDRKLAEVALHRLGLRDYFEFIITCDEVGVGKSSPKVYEEALQRLGTEKSRTLVAEDALHALQTAHAAGFPTAAIEEAHSAAQQTAKQQVATYYVFSFQGKQVFKNKLLEK